MLTAIIVGAISFILGLIGAFLLMSFCAGRNRKRRGKAKPQRAPEKKKLFDKIGVMNLALVVVVVIFIWFTHEMIDLFKVYLAVPDTVVAGVYAVLGGECGFLGWIRTSKEKNQERKWMKEDMRQNSSSDDGPMG